MSLVAENFKTQRDIGFYADKLCVTSKYLSTMLKQETGMTALDWIEKHVVLYAKSCLSSTSMTRQPNRCVINSRFYGTPVVE